jgi:hypothetical protein
VQFVVGDALQALEDEAARGGPFHVIFSSWVLGYIPLRPFFHLASRSLSAGGQLAFVVHKDRSPREPLDLFAELVARDPSVLQKRVAFDFPPDTAQLRDALREAGLEVVCLREGAAVFRFALAREVLDHLLRSGAGTAFYNAIDPARRPRLTAEFLALLERRLATPEGCRVAHEYMSCVAIKASGRGSTVSS